MGVTICPSHQNQYAASWVSPYNLDPQGNYTNAFKVSYQLNGIGDWQWTAWADGPGNHYGPAGRMMAQVPAPRSPVTGAWRAGQRLRLSMGVKG